VADTLSILLIKGGFMSDMKISKEGIADLTVSEGFSKSLYDDGGKGKGHCTIGYGHLVHHGICDGKDKRELEYLDKITKKEGKGLLAVDVGWAEKVVNKVVKVELTQGQFDAFVSFVYNIGSGNFSKSSVLNYVNKKEFDKIPGAMRLWNKSAGVALKGLKTRREREVKRFEGGTK
jgi:lysozyme